MRHKKKQSAERQRDRDFQAIATTYYQPASSQPPRARRSPNTTTTTTTVDTPDETEAPKKRRSVKKTIALTVLCLVLLILIPLLVIGIWDLRNFSHATEKLFGTTNAMAVIPPVPLAQTDGRTNVLLVGYSVDDPNHAGANLTDSIMILSLDQNTKTGYMISVPRDLYVNIPNYGYAKINEAYQSEGIDTLRSVVSDSFGIPLHYHIIINYASVRDIVNALDGITVNIESSDERGLYDPNFQPHEGGPLQLTNGIQTIDGQTALRLTRARGATYGSYGFPQSDFNRVQNQQLVLAAIKNKISWRVVLDPRVNSKIFQAIGDNMQTDLKIGNSIPFFRLFTAVPSTSLQQVNLRDFNGKNLLRSYTTRSGQSALIPAAGIDNFTDIKAAVETL